MFPDPAIDLQLRGSSNTYSIGSCCCATLRGITYLSICDTDDCLMNVAQEIAMGGRGCFGRWPAVTPLLRASELLLSQTWRILHKYL